VLQPSPWVRYYACADDTAHPEVRQVLALALGRPGSGSSSGHDAEGAGAASVVWELDPADQITEPAQPDSDDDTQDPPTVQGFGNSQGTAATPPQLTSVPASQYSQARSPLVGRCNMWNLLWSWSLKVSNRCERGVKQTCACGWADKSSMITWSPRIELQQGITHVCCVAHQEAVLQKGLASIMSAVLIETLS
jgi:hypothetical protein